jgi:hypothetical protein
MTASYKRKRFKEQDSLDARPTAIRKNLNSSERWKAKNQVAKTLNDRQDIVEDLRWELEARQSIECHQNEIFGPHTYMQNMLALLDVGDFDLYKCKCIDVYKMTDDEILKHFGE